ncbi:MAG: cysteine hydrolase family protein [Verrucomicrobiaceae bacterium]|nr:cysteine hydrolase family protein [Verrucomicrobiaceae bacterium]
MYSSLQAEPFSLTLRGSGEHAATWMQVEWEPEKTAIIVCDMWDSHHSVTAVRRVNEFAPRLNEVLKKARSRGATIIHSPSDCMPVYAGHPGRKRALKVPAAGESPEGMAAWCHRIPSEERASYPIDQSDGGEDEDAWENAQWAAQLEKDGRKPGTPWLRQTSQLEINDKDYIAAEGDVVWNILTDRGIRHVVLCGVHTNMCVLGRPFGLRQMVRAGMDTVLLRDCTDVMYNPRRWPYVSHFTGLDLVIRHIESHVCPTVTSEQFVGGSPFRFTHDNRPRLVVLADQGNLPVLQAFARRFLDPEFRVYFTVSSSGEGKEPEGLRHIEHADALLIFADHEKFPEEIKGAVLKHVTAAKPVVGAGYSIWPQVYGAGSGNPRKTESAITVRRDNNGRFESHPIASHLPVEGWKPTMSFQDTSLVPGTQVIVGGESDGKAGEVVAWAFTRSDGGRSFYSALDIPGDFVRSPFQHLLFNAVYWATGRTAPSAVPEDPDTRREAEGWHLPGGKVLAGSFRDLRTLLRVPTGVGKGDYSLSWQSRPKATVYLNGKELSKKQAGKWNIPDQALKPGDLNLLVVRVPVDRAVSGKDFPSLGVGTLSFSLPEKHWQQRYSSDSEVEVMFPIPPQFGAPTDLIQGWPMPR